MQAVASYPALVTHDMFLDAPEHEYVLRVRDIDNDQKPREKLQRMGPGALSVAELLAIIWGVGTKKEDVLVMAHRALHDYGEKAIVHETDPDKLAAILDIPAHKATQLVAALELGRRMYEQRGGRPAFIRSSAQAFEHCKPMALSQKEQCRGLYLNSRYELIHEEVISVGTLTTNVVHPREVYQPAIAHGGVAVIIAHNHPSGSLEPSDDDIRITRQLKQAGSVLGIELLDHLIITNTTFRSIIKE